MASPVAAHFPIPSPSRDSPNAHPYAIKTSSSAVLTRSNSAAHRDSTAHHYTPLSPASPLAARQSRFVPAHRSHHRPTRSLSAASDDIDIFASPPPVPLPPSPAVPAALANKAAHAQTQLRDVAASDGEALPPPTPPMTWRLKRSETLPSVFPNKSDSEATTLDFPKNPKLWTPSQLSVYLSASLRLKGAVKLPLPITRDIAAFVVKEHLSGRSFLRMKREDYEKLGINQLWQDALLDASRALRQNIVQGRIMGFGSGPLALAHEAPENDNIDNYDDDDDDDNDDTEDLPDLPPYHAGTHRTMGRTAFRAGRVRGMVETYERSVSGSSDAGSDPEENGLPAGRIVTRELSGEPEPAVDAADGADAGFASGETTSASEDDGPVVTATTTTTTTTTAADDAPSIEDLLRAQEQGEGQDHAAPWGAKAWEDAADNPHGVTARRVVGVVSPARARLWRDSLPRPGEPGAGGGAREGGGGVGLGLAGIFEPQMPVEPASVTEPVPQPAPVPAADLPAAVREVPQLLKHVTEPVGESDADLHATLAAFQKRLEAVERRLDELERHDADQDEAAARTSSSVAPPRPAEPHKEDTQPAAAKNYTTADPSLAGLPRYMFLVSLGVVAVVARVVLHRVAGGDARPKRR